VMLINGRVMLINGCVTLINGRVMLVNGSVTLINGSVMLVNGSVMSDSSRAAIDLAKYRVLRLAQEQTPLAFKDSYLGEPVKSSVRTESDLAPAKPRSDIIVLGTARVPGGAPQPFWRVRVKVGEVEKLLRVIGPRAWVRGEGGFRPTSPEPRPTCAGTASWSRHEVVRAGIEGRLGAEHVPERSQHAAEIGAGEVTGVVVHVERGTAGAALEPVGAEVQGASLHGANEGEDRRDEGRIAGVEGIEGLCGAGERSAEPLERQAGGARHGVLSPTHSGPRSR
jgi:hypothetical protein